MIWNVCFYLTITRTLPYSDGWLDPKEQFIFQRPTNTYTWLCVMVLLLVSAILHVSACSLLPNSTRGTANSHKANNTLHCVPWNHFYSVRIFENTMERSY